MSCAVDGGGDSVWVTKRQERWSACVLEEVRIDKNGREIVKSGMSIRG